MSVSQSFEYGITERHIACINTFGYLFRPQPRVRPITLWCRARPWTSYFGLRTPLRAQPPASQIPARPILRKKKIRSSINAHTTKVYCLAHMALISPHNYEDSFLDAVCSPPTTLFIKLTKLNMSGFILNF